MLSPDGNVQSMLRGGFTSDWLKQPMENILGEIFEQPFVRAFGRWNSKCIRMWWTWEKKNHGLLEGLLAYTLPQTVDEKCNTVTQTSDAHSIFVAILNQTFWCSTRSEEKFTQRCRNKLLHWRQQKPAEVLPISSEKSNAPRTDCKGIFWRYFCDCTLRTIPTTRRRYATQCVMFGPLENFWYGGIIATLWRATNPMNCAHGSLPKYDWLHDSMACLDI